MGLCKTQIFPENKRKTGVNNCVENKSQLKVKPESFPQRKCSVEIDKKFPQVTHRKYTVYPQKTVDKSIAG